MPVTNNPPRPAPVNAPERQGVKERIGEYGNPAYQSNSKVGTRRRVDQGRAQYTWRRNKKAGLDAGDIKNEEIIGWRGEFNRSNVKKIFTTDAMDPHSTIIVPRNATKVKKKYKSSRASVSAKTKNNWIIYVSLAKFYYNLFAQENELPLVKFPQLVADRILQAMFHAKDDDGNDCPMPPDHYIVFADKEARQNIELIMSTLPMDDRGNRVENIFDEGRPPLPDFPTNARTGVNNDWDEVSVTPKFKKILPPTTGFHYWPFRYTNNNNISDVRYGVTKEIYEDYFKKNAPRRNEIRTWSRGQEAATDDMMYNPPVDDPVNDNLTSEERRLGVAGAAPIQPNDPVVRNLFANLSDDHIIKPLNQQYPENAANLEALTEEEMFGFGDLPDDATSDAVNLQNQLTEMSNQLNAHGGQTYELILPPPLPDPDAPPSKQKTPTPPKKKKSSSPTTTITEIPVPQTLSMKMSSPSSSNKRKAESDVNTDFINENWRMKEDMLDFLILPASIGNEEEKKYAATFRSVLNKIRLDDPENDRKALETVSDNLEMLLQFIPNVPKSKKRASPAKQSPPKQSPPKQSPPKKSPPKQSPPKQSPPKDDVIATQTIPTVAAVVANDLIDNSQSRQQIPMLVAQTQNDYTALSTLSNSNADIVNRNADAIMDMLTTPIDTGRYSSSSSSYSTSSSLSESFNFKTPAARKNKSSAQTVTASEMRDFNSMLFDGESPDETPQTAFQEKTVKKNRSEVDRLFSPSPGNVPPVRNQLNQLLWETPSPALQRSADLFGTSPETSPIQTSDRMAMPPPKTPFRSQKKTTKVDRSYRQFILPQSPTLTTETTSRGRTIKKKKKFSPSNYK